MSSFPPRPGGAAPALPRSAPWLLAGLHFVCPLLFFTDLTRNPYFTQISLLHGGLCLVALWASLNLFRTRSVFIATTPLDLPLLVFLGAAVFSLVFSWYSHPAFRLPLANEGLRVTHFLVVNGLLVFWVSAQIPDGEWIRRIRRVLYAVGVIAGGYGILQYMGYEIVWSTALNPYSGRPVSTFGNPNFLSSYLVMLLPLVFSDGLRARSARASALWAGLFLLFSAAILCTMTRSSWIGAAAAMGVVAWFGRRRLAARRKWAGAVVLVAALLVLFWPSSPLADKSMRPVERVSELVRGVTTEKAYGSWHQRLMIWSCAWDMAKERPVWGKGWGSFELFYPFYQGWYLADEVFRNFRTHANNAHNILLEIWSQTGTIGTGIFLWIALLFFQLSRRRIPLLPEEERLDAWACLAGLTGMMADNFFGNVSVFFAVPAFLFWWIAGTLARRLSPGSVRVLNGRAPLTVFAVALAATLCVVGIARAYRHWKAEIYYFSGFKKAKQGDVRGAIADTKKSHDYRRWEVNNNYELGNAYARHARWAEERQLAQESEKALALALDAYDEAIAANAGYDEVYFNRGAVLVQLQRPDDAIESYRMALLINPLSLDAYKALGNIYLTREGMLAKAEDLFERAVFYHPRQSDLWNNLGYVYSRLEKNEKAVDAYANALRIEFRFPTAWKNLRVALASANRPDHPLLEVPALWDRIESRVRTKQWKEALEPAEKLAALLPENTVVRLTLAGIRLALDDFEKARLGFEGILARDPGNVDARKGLARLNLRRGDAGAALAILRQLVQERPDDADVAELLTRAERGTP